MIKQKKIIKITSLIIFSLALVTAAAFGFLAVGIYRDISFEGDERLFESACGFNSTTFYADGEVPVAIETGGNIKKMFYSLDEISPYVKGGFVAVEDKLFYKHKGVDIKRTLMATANYAIGSKKIFGASTITQQVIKNISGDDQLTVKRKIGEMIRALHLERNYTKEEILEVYLNVIPMSENIYGIGAASRAYFGKEPSELLPEEAAVLIGITNAPTAYNPYINPDACLRKRNIILSVMHNDGVISTDEYERAINAPLSVTAREDREDRVDSWFIETVIEDVAADFSEKYGISHSAARMTLLGGGYKIYTTMDTKVQERLEKYFENTDNFPVETANGLNYAMAITDADSGYLVAVVGGVGEKQGNRLYNHATSLYAPASTLKPIALYAPLIDEGRINWASVFDDVPVSFIETEEGCREYPRNSPNVYDGLTTVKDAIRNSKNTIAVRLCDMITPKRVFNSLRDDFGFSTLIERDGGLTDIAVAPMALGQLGRGVSLIKMTESFSVFSGEGEWREAISYLSVLDKDGKAVLKNEQSSKRIFKDTTARIMNRLLMNVTEDGTAGRITLKESINTAGKTGTASGNKNKSFIGYTPYYTAGIWCGYDSERAIGALSKSHLQIWDEVMQLIHGDIIAEGNVKEFSAEGLQLLPYCKDSGGLFTEACAFDPRGSRVEVGYFSEDNLPTERCDRHILCKYDSITKAIACKNCPEENIINVALLKINDRNFPKEIYVTDAEFVYRDIDGYTPRPIDFALPYFEYSLPEGVYVGKGKSKKQFNSNCYLHDE